MDSPTHHIDLKVLFAGHASESDRRFKLPYLERADIYIPEGSGLPLVFRDRIIQVVLGNSPLDELDELGLSPHLIKDFTALAGTRKKILFVDVPEEHPSLEDSKRSRELDSQSKLSFITGNLVAAVKLKRTAEESASKYKHARELHIKGELMEQLTSMLSTNNLNAVMSIGAAHAEMDLDLGEHIKVEGIWQVKPKIKSPTAEIERRMINKLTCDDEMFARALVFELLVKFLLQFSEQTLKAIAVSAFIASKLTFNCIDKIQKESRISEVMLTMRALLFLNGNIFQVAESFFRDFFKLVEEYTKIKIPKSEEELETMYQLIPETI